MYVFFGGSERIRTSEGLNIPSSFQDCPVRPLRHASIYGKKSKNCRKFVWCGASRCYFHHYAYATSPNYLAIDWLYYTINLQNKTKTARALEPGRFHWFGYHTFLYEAWASFCFRSIFCSEWAKEEPLSPIKVKITGWIAGFGGSGLREWSSPLLGYCCRLQACLPQQAFWLCWPTKS